MLQPSAKKPNRAPASWWIIGMLAVLAALILIVVTSRPPESPPSISLASLPSNGTTLGSATAPITVEEYGDFQCPACGMFARGTLKEIEAKYVQNGTVKIVFHYFAILGDESVRAAEAAECANTQGKFWQYYDTLFNHQAGENQGAFSDDRLASLAQPIVPDMGKFNTCLKTDQTRAKVLADVSAGQTRGVQRIPTLFINGQESVGVISLAQFEALIAPYLK